MKIIFLIAVALLFVGCGADGYYVIEEKHNRGHRIFYTRRNIETNDIRVDQLRENGFIVNEGDTLLLNAHVLLVPIVVKKINK